MGIKSQNNIRIIRNQIGSLSPTPITSVETRGPGFDMRELFSNKTGKNRRLDAVTPFLEKTAGKTEIQIRAGSFETKKMLEFFRQAKKIAPVHETRVQFQRDIETQLEFNDPFRNMIFLSSASIIKPKPPEREEEISTWIFGVMRSKDNFNGPELVFSQVGQKINLSLVNTPDGDYEFTNYASFQLLIKIFTIMHNGTPEQLQKVFAMFKNTTV